MRKNVTKRTTSAGRQNTKPKSPSSLQGKPAPTSAVPSTLPKKTPITSATTAESDGKNWESDVSEERILQITNDISEGMNVCRNWHELEEAIRYWALQHSLIVPDARNVKADATVVLLEALEKVLKIEV